MQHPIADIPCTSDSKDEHVPGLVLEEGFLSEEEERDVMSQLDALRWESQVEYGSCMCVRGWVRTCGGQVGNRDCQWEGNR